MRVYRDSSTGRWVTKAFALRNPATTQSHEREDLDETHGPLNARMAHVLEGIASAAPEDTAEWLLEGQEILAEARMEAIWRSNQG